MKRVGKRGLRIPRHRLIFPTIPPPTHLWAPRNIRERYRPFSKLQKAAQWVIPLNYHQTDPMKAPLPRQVLFKGVEYHHHP